MLTIFSPLIVALEGEKYIVPAVFDEVVTKGKEMDYPDAVSTASLVEEVALKVKAPRRKGVIVISSLHKDIHAGESEVIVLAQEMSAIAVIYDRVTRAVVKYKGSVSEVPTESYSGRLR
jgi:predicted nucleic acid-binding protein